MWATFWGERIRDWDMSEQFSSFLWRDTSYARPGCMLAGIIAAIVIVMIALVMTAIQNN